MFIHRDLGRLPIFRNAVVTIGSFDGVHAGHRIILGRLRELAAHCQGESIVVTFHPHPRSVVFTGDDVPKLLTSIEERAALLESCGIDHLVVVPFDEEFSKQTPEEYVRNFLVSKFHPSHIVIGYDHKFGKNRAGNIDLLKSLSAECHFQVTEISKQEVEDMAVSSSKIRKALQSADIATANTLLAAPYRLTGKVVHGLKLGRTIGFATANLMPSTPEKLVPAFGIYAVKAYVRGQSHNGMLYIGDRPSIENAKGVTIETNIFDFQQDIYDEELTLEFIAYIRTDKKFDGLEKLKEQLKADEVAARKILLANS